MKLEQLIYLTTIAETKSFSRAAEKLYISQPSISIAIAELEDELGIKLFERTRKGTFLCEHAHPVLEEAKNVVSSVGKIKSMSSNIVTALEHSLTIAAIPSIEAIYLTQVICEFRKKFPDYNIYIHSMPASKILDMLYSNEADICIIAKLGLHNIDFDNTSFTPFFTSRYIACARIEDAALYQKRKIQLKDIKEPIFLNVQKNKNLSTTILKPLLPYIAHKKTSLQTPSYRSMLEMCAGGLGIGILPEFIFQFYFDDFNNVLAPLELQDSIPEIHYGAVYKKSFICSEIFTSFLDLLRSFPEFIGKGSSAREAAGGR